MTVSKKIGQGLKTFTSDVAEGFFEITHNGFALVGLIVMFACLTLIARPELRQEGELKLINWLQARQVDVSGYEVMPDTAERTTAINPSDLPKKQAAVAYWLSKKYRVAPEPLSALVAEAFEIGARTKLEPTLLLAIMAIESGFNPFAQSPVGAQGLMQVMTRIHSDKYQNFGGQLAAFDPLTNLRVGTKVLQECIARAGSLEAGLRYYVGAANLEDDGGYTSKVLAEHARLNLVMAGLNVPTHTPSPSPVPTPALTTTPTPSSTPAPTPALAPVKPVPVAEEELTPLNS